MSKFFKWIQDRLTRIFMYLFDFNLKQFQWYRRWRGGRWYYMGFNINVAPFWDNELIKCCGMRVIKEEDWG